jgi:diacylglycerol O-acyltransferase
MTGSDAGWFRMDRPENQADIVVLLSFDRPLELDVVRQLVEQRLLRIARFRQRPVPSWVGPPAWEVDPGFSLDRHLVPARLGPGGLRDLAGEVTTAPLDPAHPMWRIHVVEGEREGALVAKLQHSIGDGFALVAAFLALADERAGGEPPHPARPAPRGRGARAALAGLRSLPGEAAAIAMGLGRLAALRWDPAAIAAVPLSGVRRVAWTAGLPFAAVREAARRRGGTANDLLAAAIAGGLRAHLAAAGLPVDRPFRAFVPVNLRRAPPDVGAGDPLGNEFGLVYVDLPVDLPSPEARFEVVRRTVSAQRRGGDPRLTSAVLAACGWLPDVAHHALTRFFARKASAVITSVPGPRAPIHVAGRRLTAAMFWVPHPASLALGVSILTYAGEVRVGVRADAALLPEPERLAAAVEREAEALGAPTAGAAAVTPL